MPYPWVIPHSDGAGTIDKVGDGVNSSYSSSAERVPLAGVAHAHELVERGTAGRVVITIDDRVG